MKKLVLASNDIGGEVAGAVCVASALVEDLDVAENRFGVDLRWGDAIEEALHCTSVRRGDVGNPRCTALRLASNHLGNGGATEVVTALLNNTSVIYLDFASNFVCEAFGWFAMLLKGTKCLQVLKLRDNELRAEGCLEVAKAAAKCATLTELDLAQNQIGPADVHVCQACANITTIVSLDLRGNLLGPKAVQALADGVPTLPELRSLGLSGSALAPEAGDRVGLAVPLISAVGSSQVSSLDLGGCGLVWRDLAAACEALAANCALTSLDLSVNNCGKYDLADERQHLVKVVFRQRKEEYQTWTVSKEGREFQLLEMKYQKQVERDEKEREKRERERKRLEMMKGRVEGRRRSSTEDVPPVNAGIPRLQKPVPPRKKPVVDELWTDPESDPGPMPGVRIAQALRGNTVLLRLNVSNNKLDAEGTAAIAQAMEENATLTELDLRGNELGRPKGVSHAPPTAELLEEAQFACTAAHQLPEWQEFERRCNWDMLGQYLHKWKYVARKNPRDMWGMPVKQAKLDAARAWKEAAGDEAE